jgi:uncharacterized OB-fold protein
MGGPVARRLRPVDDDLDTGPFFAAARRGELVVQRCAGCTAVLHVPRRYCRACGSWESRWDVVPGRAVLHSWTVVTHQVHPAYPVPYTVVLVELAGDGVRLVGSLPGEPTLVVGMAMQVWFEEVGGGVVQPNWRPAGPLADGPHSHST